MTGPQPSVEGFFDAKSNTVTYLVWDAGMLLPALQVNIRGGRVPDVIQLPITWAD